jgi:peptide deformylase
MNDEKCEIITDASALRQVSAPVDLNSDYLPKINKLLQSFPAQHLGLAAPQIGIFERFFVANLSIGRFVFVNPQLKLQPSTIASTEGCLSVPNVQKTILRHEFISINADKIFKVVGGSVVTPSVCTFGSEESKLDTKLCGLDACVIQHEYDHLEGVLIIDHGDVLNPGEQRKRREEKKLQKKIEKKKLKRNQKSQQTTIKISDNQLKELDRKFKLSEKRNKKRVEIQERQRAIREESI